MQEGVLNFKELSQDGGWPHFSKNPHASLRNKYLSNDISTGSISLDSTFKIMLIYNGCPFPGDILYLQFKIKCYNFYGNELYIKKYLLLHFRIFLFPSTFVKTLNFSQVFLYF
jgi:hypothetical protein